MFSVHHLAEVWLELSMLPFLLVLSIFLAGRLATSSEINKRFLHLVLSTLIAAILEVSIELHNDVNADLLINKFFHAVIVINAYSLFAYVAAYTHQSSQKFIGSHFFILCLAVCLIFAFKGNSGLVFAPAFAVMFVAEAFVLQLLFQQYYSNGQFIVMNTLFMLLIDAFLLQYLFRQNLPLVYPVATLMLVFTFFYLEAPTYRKLIQAHRDIDYARVRAENSIMKANIANKAKSNFLASTSHEIRTPMNAILGINDLILEQRPDNEARNAAVAIKSAGEYLLALVNNILDISKIEAGKMDLYEADYHLWDLLKDCENDMTTRLKGKPEVKFSIHAQQDLPEHLFGDSLRLKQIITNLLSNAAKFTATGKISLNVSGIRKSTTDLLLTIIVSDTGSGINQQDINIIFQPFERANIIENRHIQGAGLGLTLVLNIVNIMNGNISVNSQAGIGSEFTVTVPQKITPDTLTVKQYEDFLSNNAPVIQAVSPDIWPDAHLLVVDDTPVNLVVAKGMLNHSEALVDTCESGEQALELIKANHYDIVFLDHKMPGMDGVETLAAIKKSIPECKAKFIALTANSGPNARQEYISLGFDDYLAKPFKQMELINILRACLNH